MIGMSDVLTIDAMAADPEAVLTLPLPPTPSVELLDEARHDILDYLDELTGDLDDDAPVEQVRREMERATTRLLEISLRLPAARAAESEADAKEPQPEPQPDGLDFEPPGEVWRDESPLTTLLFLTEGLADQIESTVRSLPADAKNEQRFLALLLAHRCLEMFKDKEGREYRLDQKTGAALDALFDKFEDAERGFGPWEPHHAAA
jgi:hypothetical protein